MVLNSYNNISSGINGKATNAEAFTRSIGSGVEGEANLYTFLGNIENGKDFRPGQGEVTLNGMGGKKQRSQPITIHSTVLEDLCPPLVTTDTFHFFL